MANQKHEDSETFFYDSGIPRVFSYPDEFIRNLLILARDTFGFGSFVIPYKFSEELESVDPSPHEPDLNFEIFDVVWNWIQEHPIAVMARYIKLIEDRTYQFNPRDWSMTSDDNRRIEFAGASPNLATRYGSALGYIFTVLGHTVYIPSSSIEDGLEEFAEYLVKNAPGYVTPFEDLDPDEALRWQETGELDGLTYTESGFIDEGWGVYDVEDPIILGYHIYLNRYHASK